MTGPRSIAALRQSPHVGLPEATYHVCVAGALAGEFNELDRLWREAEAEYQAAKGKVDPDRPHPRQRIGAQTDVGALQAKADEIAQRADAVAAQMQEHMVDVKLRGIVAADWRRWKLDHPPRDDVAEDGRLGVNFDDVLDELERWVVHDESDPPLTGPGDWEWVRSNMTAGDLWAVAATVVNLHEVSVTIPKSRTGLAETLRSDADSARLNLGASRRGSSRGGSRDSSTPT